MLAMTSEYATGSIRTTLQWVPRRGLLLAARTLVVVGIVTVLGMLLTLATDLTAWAILRDAAHVDVGDVARSVGFVGVVLAAAGMLAVGLGAALRSSAGTMTTLFLLLAVLPALLPSFGVPWLTRVGHVLPGSAALSLLGMVEPVLSRAGAWLVLAGWTAVWAPSGCGPSCAATPPDQGGPSYSARSHHLQAGHDGIRDLAPRDPMIAGHAHDQADELVADRHHHAGRSSWPASVRASSRTQ